MSNPNRLQKFTYVYPANERPISNNEPAKLASIGSTPFKPNPIKHWRKRLYTPNYDGNRGRIVSISTIDAPGRQTYSTLTDASLCSLNAQILYQNTILMNQCLGVVDANGSCKTGTTHVRRPASTVISQNYYPDYKQYLKSRCKSYEQNNSLGKQISDGVYASTSMAGECSTGVYKNVIYKPTNSAFSKNDAVSGSTYVANKHNETVTKNGASLYSAFGESIVVAKPYALRNDVATIYLMGKKVGSGASCTSIYKLKCPSSTV